MQWEISQPLQEVRKTNYVGLDVCKKYVDATVLDEEVKCRGKVVNLSKLGRGSKNSFRTSMMKMLLDDH